MSSKMPRKKRGSDGFPRWGWWVIAGFVLLLVLGWVTLAGMWADIFRWPVVMLSVALGVALPIAAVAGLIWVYFIPAWLGRDSPRLLAIFGKKPFFRLDRVGMGSCSCVGACGGWHFE